MSTIAALFAANVAADPAKPLLTWYDDATGERTELSGATLNNWVSKTANLLVDGLGLSSGDVAAIEAPPHWQTASIMLACWTAGLAVSHTGGARTDVAFILPDGTGNAPDVFVLGLHPFALPVRDLPAGTQDWVLAARAHGDHFHGPTIDSTAAALTDLPGGGTVSHAELATHALARADELGIGPGDRVLINVDTHRRPMDWLAAGVAAGASLVLSYQTDPTKLESRASAERVTVTLP